jgi:hypothetical protein
MNKGIPADTLRTASPPWGRLAAGPRSFPIAFHCTAPMEGTGVKLF